MLLATVQGHAEARVGSPPRMALESQPAAGRAVAHEVTVADRPDEPVTTAWTRYHDELIAFLFRACHDRDAAEDMLQDAYLRLIREVRAGREPDNVRAWLYRVAGNLAIDRGRRNASGHRFEARTRSALGQVADDAPGQALLEKEATDERLGALAILTPRARRALSLAAEGFSGEEIALLIGCSPIAARTVLHRARARARRCLVA